MRLALCMAGTDDGRAAFWARYEKLGLEPVTDIVHQFNTPFGRDRQNERNYPEDWPTSDFTAAAAAMGANTSASRKTRNTRTLPANESVFG